MYHQPYHTKIGDNEADDEELDKDDVEVSGKVEFHVHKLFGLIKHDTQRNMFGYCLMATIV